MSKISKRSSVCVYCGRGATTRDHVPPKCLLNAPYPSNLLTVPCCQACNNSFSKDEEYLLYLLSTIGDSDTLLALQKPQGTIDRAIARSSLLYDRIINALAVDESGRVYLTPERPRIERIAIKIAMGIHFRKYRYSRPVTDFNCLGTFHGVDHVPAPLLLLTYTERFLPKKWTIVQRDVFSYVVVRNWQNNKLLLVLNFHNTLLSYVEMRSPLWGKRNRNTTHPLQGTLFADYR